MRLGDTVTAQHNGETGRGQVEAVRGGRALVRLTIRSAEPWTSPLTGGTIPAGCPLTYLLWLRAEQVTAVRLMA